MSNNDTTRDQQSCSEVDYKDEEDNYYTDIH